LAAYPAGAYGLASAPAQPAALLVRGATIWTSGPAGRLDDADLLVRSGRIEAVGRDLDIPRGAMIIDAAGKHVTAGLVDAHSHTAISRGINETGSAVTIEVRIADVLDPTDINIYRQLAGGLTSANIMHGSANPMGGQVQTIKLRWGEDADGLLFAGAPAGVKFALGENVKQSNWGDQYTTRYPQSRMGVDEIIRDTFDAALAYGEARANVGRNDPPVRRNLRLDAALEILNRDRRIHIHSYRQDEILAFVRLAQEYGLDVAAFQHVLEGYKVGPEIASIGAGGSTFSDWWGYKYEVIDAIPYNGALMREAGVVVSFNSDDDELATRLNTEAAKGVKYGGVPEIEAFDFVTINPAIQLGIDDRVGSLEPGKDADFVIWSGDPLATFSRAEQTWIEGRRYFDIEADAEARDFAIAERSRLIQKVLDERLDDSGPPDGADQAGSTAGSDESDRQFGRDRNTDLYSSVVRRSHAMGEGNE
jgi:imidazolonepropionase-like amidohydrolase